MDRGFSLSMSVYGGDRAEFFRRAVVSATVEQTLPPAEVVLVVDGPVAWAIDEMIAELQDELPMPLTVVRLQENVGHARSRQAGLEATRYRIVAMHDSDDVCHPERFARQMEYLEQHPDVNVVGAQITEFVGSEDNVVATRRCPEGDEDIKRYMKDRCPMNFVTVMVRKDSVLQAGGFIDWYCEEDYYLWVRMVENGCKFGNLPEVLVNARVGSEMYRRRGGWRYFKSEARLQRYMLSRGIISWPRYAYNVAIRFAVQVLMPNGLRGWVCCRFARKKQ